MPLWAVIISGKYLVSQHLSGTACDCCFTYKLLIFSPLCCISSHLEPAPRAAFVSVAAGSERSSQCPLPLDPLLAPCSGWRVQLGLLWIWRCLLPPPFPAWCVMDSGCCVPTVAKWFLTKRGIRACNRFIWELQGFSKWMAARGYKPAWRRLVLGAALLGRAGSGFWVVITDYPMAMDCIPGPAGLLLIGSLF